MGLRGTERSWKVSSFRDNGGRGRQSRDAEAGRRHHGGLASSRTAGYNATRPSPPERIAAQRVSERLRNAREEGDAFLRRDGHPGSRSPTPALIRIERRSRRLTGVRDIAVIEAVAGDSVLARSCCDVNPN